jgi:hypothetical protein
MTYNTTTSEIQYNTGKTFVIDHPLDTNKYLVHACLEGPEAGVYYRGESEIKINENESTIVLPNYVSELAKEFTVQVTPIFDGFFGRNLYCSRVVDGKFTVYGKSGPFFWVVYGKRSNIEVEPVKNEVSLSGSGPYKWIEKI